MNYLPSKVPLNKPSWQRHSNAKSLHVSRVLFIHLSDCIFRMLLFLPIIFSIMYKVLLEAFNRGPTQWHERHSIHFLFERHGHHDYPMLLPTNKRIHLRTNRMFYFPFRVFYIAAFQLPPSERGKSQKTQHEYLILENVAHTAIFTVQGICEKKGRPKLYVTDLAFFFVYHLLRLWTYVATSSGAECVWLCTMCLISFHHTVHHRVI